MVVNAIDFSFSGRSCRVGRGESKLFLSQLGRHESVNDGSFPNTTAFPKDGEKPRSQNDKNVTSMTHLGPQTIKGSRTLSLEDDWVLCAVQSEAATDRARIWEGPKWNRKAFTSVRWERHKERQLIRNVFILVGLDSSDLFCWETT